MIVFTRALLARPKYLLLDEPFQGLQKEAGDKIIETIKKLKEKGIGVAIISHERIEELVGISNKFYIMIAGKVAYEGQVKSVEETLSRLGEFMLV